MNNKLEKEKSRKLQEVFGAQIKQAREALGYTQADLARKVDMDRQYISKIERGERMTHPNSLLRFSETLGIDFTISARIEQAVEDIPALPAAGNISSPVDPAPGGG